MTINFQEIKRKIVKRGKCIKCGKNCTRTIVENQTVNPFNKNKDGTIKSYNEVSLSVSENLKKRVGRFDKEGFVCKSCKEYLGY